LTVIEIAANRPDETENQNEIKVKLDFIFL
jgi:hypothetical protein